MWQFIIENFNEFLTYTGFANASVGNLIMIVVGAILIYLAIKKDFEPHLLWALFSVTFLSGPMPDWRLVSMRITPCSTSSIKA